MKYEIRSKLLKGSKRGHSRGTTSTEANSTPTGDVGPSVKKEATPSETGASGSSGPVSSGCLIFEKKSSINHSLGSELINRVQPVSALRFL